MLGVDSATQQRKTSGARGGPGQHRMNAYPQEPPAGEQQGGHRARSSTIRHIVLADEPTGKPRSGKLAIDDTELLATSTHAGTTVPSRRVDCEMIKARQSTLHHARSRPFRGRQLT